MSDRLWELYDVHGPDYARIADALNAAGIPLTRSQVRHRIKKGRPTVTPPSDTVESEPGEPISLDELLAKHAVDVEAFEVTSFVVNQWSGDQFQTKASLRRRVTENQESWREALLADISADTRQRPRIAFKPGRIPEGEAHAVEVDLFDAHFGKLAWGDETNAGDYDTEIAEAQAREALTDLLWQCERYPVERFIIPFGNDFFHYDNLLGTTTAGTPQDRDTRLLKMFRRGRGFASWAIRLLAERAPVLAPIVPGNHAATLEMMLGEVLAAEFANDPRVTIDNTPPLRKYVQYGKNLIAYTHGNEEPHGKLPQIMAAEVPQMWADTIHREWHLGHIHKQKTTGPVTVDDQTGATIRIIRSLSGTDAWHFKKGYVGGTKGAEAFVWRKSGGLRAHLYTFPTAKAA